MHDDAKRRAILCRHRIQRVPQGGQQATDTQHLQQDRPPEQLPKQDQQQASEHTVAHNSTVPVGKNVVGQREAQSMNTSGRDPPREQDRCVLHDHARTVDALPEVVNNVLQALELFIQQRLGTT